MNATEKVMEFIGIPYKIQDNVLLTKDGKAFSIEGNALFAAKKILAAYGYSLWRWSRVAVSQKAALDLALFADAPNYTFEMGSVRFFINGSSAKAEFLNEVGKIKLEGEEYSVYKADGIPLSSLEVLPRFSGELVINMEKVLADKKCRHMFFSMFEGRKKTWWSVV